MRSELVDWWRRTRSSAMPRRIREEEFGAIAQLQRPRALAFVDRVLARRLGVTESSLWQGAESGAELNTLSAPLEAHLQLTNQCDAGCSGCYTAASPKGIAREWGKQAWMRAVDELADAGVFHLALGGGESAILPWLGDIARHARSRGLVPNLTTSGLAGLNELLPIADLFGQINVSIDGLGKSYARVRGFDGFAQADHAVQALRLKKREIGINVVVTRANFDELDSLFAYARKRRLNEIELLRYKPAGRAVRTFSEVTCTDAQHRELLPVIKRAARRYRVKVRVDCSYVPMLVHHRPKPEFLRKLAVYGCTAGDFLIGAKADGSLVGCSFAPPPASKPKVDNLRSYWQSDGAFADFRSWRNAEEPCRSCDYLSLCRGGCKVVSRHQGGGARRPDPECPRVVDHRLAEGGDKESSDAQTGARVRNRLPVVL